ncbi:hypothetical protein D3C78_1429590 [compost metagenome]
MAALKVVSDGSSTWLNQWLPNAPKAAPPTLSAANTLPDLFPRSELSNPSEKLYCIPEATILAVSGLLKSAIEPTLVQLTLFISPPLKNI